MERDTERVMGRGGVSRPQNRQLRSLHGKEAALRWSPDRHFHVLRRQVAGSGPQEDLAGSLACAARRLLALQPPRPSTSDQFLCKKHKQPFEYIDRPLSPDWVLDYEREEIHLELGQFITRDERCIGYADEFSPYYVYGNEVTLYNNNLKKLRKLIRNRTIPNSYYVCHMTKTFATPRKTMYFLVPFSKGSIFPHMDANNELPVSNGDGTVNAKVRFIKGVDNRATITKNWSAFFRQEEMVKGRVYAFAFKCSAKGLRMIVYPL
ncbi:uncharacterized protein [Triticum aestivum]|uniref:uncharacterized protein n=1 Tax=Triticum aestivum TaxID=4565 RepID=UPI001D00D7E5|nr:uncharacterized protein LOC123089884 [Triticum aestivum]